MLKNTFLHIPGIGSITEQRLWNSGITDWDTSFDNTPLPISSNRKITITKGIVSYNGKSFDVPFIENYFGIQLSHAQIDLRYVLGSLGYIGGLKGCERQLVV